MPDASTETSTHPSTKTSTASRDASAAAHSMSQANQATIERLYGALSRLDGDTMQACYADDARFDDEAFSLHGAVQIGDMWKMLCEATRAKGADVWKVSWRDVRADATQGTAHWDAHYRFSSTGRIVDNAIDSQFDFDADNRIARQHDRFDFWTWSRQALGAPGLLLGWSPMLRKKVRATAAGNLANYMRRRNDSA